MKVLQNNVHTNGKHLPHHNTVRPSVDDRRKKKFYFMSFFDIIMTLLIICTLAIFEFWLAENDIFFVIARIVLVIERIITCTWSLDPISGAVHRFPAWDGFQGGETTLLTLIRMLSLQKINKDCGTSVNLKEPWVWRLQGWLKVHMTRNFFSCFL